MNPNRIIATFLLSCLIINLNSCYTRRVVPVESLQLEKHDKILAYIEKNDTLNQIMIESGKYRFNGAYLYMDTLFVKLKDLEEKERSIIEYSIPVSEIKSVEIKEFEKKKTIQTIVITSGSVVLFFTYYAISGLIIFSHILSTLW